MRVHQPLSMGSAGWRVRRQDGFSLIELLVSLAIGLIVSLAVMMGYLAASQSQRGQTDLTRMQEAARFTFDLFGRETRQAGYANNARLPNTNIPAPAYLQYGNTLAPFDTKLSGSDGNQGSTPTPYLPGSATGIGTTNGYQTINNINNSDIITFRYYGNDKLDGSASDGTVLNCTGTALRGDDFYEDSVYVARDLTNKVTDSAGEPTLFCATRVFSAASKSWTLVTGSPVALIPGVETLQVLYGEDSEPDGAINRYVPKGLLTTPADANFSFVKAIMVSMVVRSPSPSGFQSTTPMNLFGPDYVGDPTTDPGAVFTPPADGRLRRVYSSVFSFRSIL
ncbi:MAG: Type fimbrial biosis protein PilW [Betaproteobacteria bacterium]|nr:Type fimbrial biosis protein PilW [Betaproteobacteria bacterium]